MISKKYSEFLPSMQSAQDLVTQVDKLSDDIDQLKSRIESEVRIVILVGLYGGSSVSSFLRHFSSIQLFKASLSLLVNGR